MQAHGRGQVSSTRHNGQKNCHIMQFSGQRLLSG